MYRGSNPRIFPLIVTILVIALVIAALVSIGRMIFFGGNKTAQTDTQESAKTTTAALRNTTLNTTDNRGVRLTVRGPIIADEKFKSYQITVTPKTRTYTVYMGYLGQVLNEKDYGNNTKAYEEFVYAIDKANIGKVNDAKDEEFRGVCATRGIAFMYETLVNFDKDQSVWTTTCGGSKGTMGANVQQIHALFANQIPDFKPSFNEMY